MKFKFFPVVVIFLFIHSISIAQLNYGKITSPKAWHSFNKNICIACDGTQSINNIYQSENEFEIRLDFIDSQKLRRLYVLTYDGARNWNCIFIVDTISYIKDGIIGMKSKSKKYSMIPDIGFDSVFAVLKENDIFKLQTDPTFPFHDSYSVIIKAKRKIYYYRLPELSDILKPNEPNGNALSYYNIINIFRNHFQPKE